MLCRSVFVTDEQLVGSYISADFINEETGEVIAEAGDELSEPLMNTLVEAGAKEVSLLAIDHINVGAYFRNTLAVDKNPSREEALDRKSGVKGESVSVRVERGGACIIKKKNQSTNIR